MAEQATYNFVVYKLKDDVTWRVLYKEVFDKKVLPKHEVTHAKMLSIGRVTGDIRLFKLDNSL